MADALLSPAVGGTMCAVSAAAVACCSRRLKTEADERKIPLMGVMGAFLFAAQMINFTIPATGSSGHLGGGLLLTILLGPHAAFLAIASVLVVQALFFADGGLLALGCNIFNMGFIPAFLVYPLCYTKIAGAGQIRWRRTTAIMISAIAVLQLGPFAVVLETTLSGISSLPFATFLLFMQPIHLAIGVVEGLVTIAIVSFVFRIRPEILPNAAEPRPEWNHGTSILLISLLIAALLTCGVFSWFTSRNPDGLEWSIAKAGGKEGMEGQKNGLHGALADLQERIAILPGYAFSKSPSSHENAKLSQASTPATAGKSENGDKAGTSVAGLAGTLMVMALIWLCAWALKRRNNAV